MGGKRTKEAVDEHNSTLKCLEYGDVKSPFFPQKKRKKFGLQDNDCVRVFLKLLGGCPSGNTT